MMMTRPRTELLLILLLVSRCSPDVIPDLDLVEETLSDLGDLESLGRDFSQIYTGWVNSSFIYPYYLKVRSFLAPSGAQGDTVSIRPLTSLDRLTEP